METIKCGCTDESGSGSGNEVSDQKSKHETLILYTETQIRAQGLLVHAQSQIVSRLQAENYALSEDYRDVNFAWRMTSQKHLRWECCSPIKQMKDAYRSEVEVKKEYWEKFEEYEQAKAELSRRRRVLEELLERLGELVCGEV